MVMWWLGLSLFITGFKPIKNPGLQDSMSSQTNYKSNTGQMDWPESPQVQKHVWYSKPTGWVHSDWSWQSKVKVKYSGSIHLDPDKVEYHLYLRALKCQGCGMIVHLKTSTWPSIAYIATQVMSFLLFSVPSDYPMSKFSLSSLPVFSRTDTVTDSEHFYNSILDLLEDVEEVQEVDDLISWWNW